MAKKVLLEINLKKPDKTDKTKKKHKKKEIVKEEREEKKQLTFDVVCRRFLIFLTIAVCCFFLYRNSRILSERIRIIYDDPKTAAPSTEPEDLFSTGPGGRAFFSSKKESSAFTGGYEDSSPVNQTNKTRSGILGMTNSNKALRNTDASEQYPDQEKSIVRKEKRYASVSDERFREGIESIGTNKSGESKESKEERTSFFPEKLRIIRIASWNPDPLDFKKVSENQTGDRIADLFLDFDLIAVQGLHARNESVANALLYLLEKRGAHYNFLMSETVPDGSGGTAFFYNTERIDADFETVRSYTGPAVCQGRRFLCASFRTNLVSSSRAFTFTLVNIDLPPFLESSDRDFLYDLYRTVRETSGRSGIPEDDIILLGSFNASIDQLGAIGQIANMSAVHCDKSTCLAGDAFDNILFDSRAVTEYIERFGIVDLEQYFHISREEAEAISKHRPVWADFSVLENGLH